MFLVIDGFVIFVGGFGVVVDDVFFLVLVVEVLGLVFDGVVNGVSILVLILYCVLMYVLIVFREEFLFVLYFIFLMVLLIVLG